MKSLIVFVVVLVTLDVVISAAIEKQGFTDEEKQKIKKHREECVSETKVDQTLIDRADKGDFVDDDKLKCFTKCFYQKAGFVTEEGELNLDVIKAKIPATVNKEKALKVVEDCQHKGKDACETVYLVHKCYFEKTHANANQESSDSSDVKVDADKPEEKVEEKPVEKVEETPMEKVEEKPVEKVEEKPVEKVEEKLVEKVEEKPVEKVEEKPMEKPEENPVVVDKVEEKKEIETKETVEENKPKRVLVE